MKRLLIISALLVILFSCKKEITKDQNDNSLPTSIKLQLKDSITENDFQQLDFNNAEISRFPKNNFQIARIPFINKSIAKDFVLIKIEKSQIFSMGRIINITKDMPSDTSINLFQFNGKINIYTLKRELKTASLIEDGFVTAFHSNPNTSNMVFKQSIAEVPLMPEVIVRSSYGVFNAWYYTDWYNLQSFFNDAVSGGGGNSSYYNYSSPQNSGGGGKKNGATGSAYPIDPDPIYIDFEPVENLPSIDIQKYIKCFSNIPDDGAICTIKILTDIPVDSDPGAFFNWTSGSPGHTFLQLKKTNGTQTTQQNIGFYPDQGWKTLEAKPVKGKFVDNADHEFNASLSMTMTPVNFQVALNLMQSLANFIEYDVDNYNCTDFTLDVFNINRINNPLTVPRYNIFGGNSSTGTATPQGLYKKIRSMKAQGIEASEIIIPGVKGFTGASDGPCN